MILIPEIHAKRIAPRRFSTQAGKYGFFLLAAFYGSSAIAQPPPGQVFYDVAESSPYFNATTTMYQLGLSVGCDTSPDFCPNNNLLRQDMAVFIVTAWSARMWNNSTAFLTQDPPSSSAYFSDVSSSSPQFPYIQKLYELGVTAGTVAPQINGSTGQVTALGQFSPGGTLTNYQIAVFATVAGALAANQCAAPYFTTLKPFPLSTNTNCTPGYFGSGPSQNPYFSDVVSGNNYFKFVQQLGDSGAVAPPSVPSGYPGCTTCVFGGNNAITRGQMAIWTVVGMGLDPRSVLSMNAVGYGGGPNYYSTLPTVTAAFTYTLHDQEYGENDIQGAQFALADSNGVYHCPGYWADPSYVLYLSDAVPPEQTFGYNIPQSDAFCTVSLVSYTPSPTDPTAVTVVLNFTFSPGFTGAYTVISQVNYYSGYSAPLENVGTLTLQAPPTYNPAPAVTLTDTTQSSGYYYVGDNFTVTVAGPANVAGLPVSLTQNGIYYGQCGICGTTNSSGVYQISGTWTAAEVGSYTQTWYVAGAAAVPGLSFQIATPPPTCSGMTPKYLGTLQVGSISQFWIISAQGVSAGETVTVLVWNESQTIANAMSFAGQPGSSTVTLSSSSFTQLGSYTVEVQVTRGGSSLMCPGAAFFAVFDDTKNPPPAPKVACTTMAGTWTSTTSSTGPLILAENNAGAISGTATENFNCGSAVWPVSSSGVSNGSATLNFGTPSPSSLSCTLLSVSEVHQVTFTNSFCDIMSDSYTARYANGSSASGTATLTSTPAVPAGETSAFVKWNTAAGYSTEAFFSMTLPALPNGEQFGGRTVSESASALTDGCNQITGIADVGPPFQSSDVAGSWFVQSNNQYYYDEMGYGPAVARYYQTYAGSNGCALQFAQTMSINSNAGSGQPIAYATHAVTAAVTPSSVSVTRDNATSGVLTYPVQ